ncbi:SYF2 splicing factor-domain-containing protein [Glomus cerebriforme]|uniref:Pre-mRNA-splicing factor SYF2 n=1 Tax=Glomus cerebriforme TaxID=658196 RepID=A0A397TGE0_9GLOM|nr:SYF2 splicing factor-domain-containing protein [Glomus cerebriforme]
MPPKKKNTKSNQIQPENPVDQIIQNVVQDFVNEATSTSSTSPSQEMSTPKKRTRKPRTTKKKDLSSQEESNIMDPDVSASPVVNSETQSQEIVTSTKKRPGRKPKVKQQEVDTVKEELQEQQQQQQYMATSMTAAPQHQLLFINATPEEPVKKKPGRKPKAKKQEEVQQQQHPEEKIVNIQPKPAAIPTSSSSPAAIRNLINLDEDSFHPYGFNKREINLSESQGKKNYNSPPVAPSPVVHPTIAPIVNPLSTVTPSPAPAPSKRGRPKKVKVDSQTGNAPDITESHDTKPAPTRKRKPRKQEVSTEPDKQSEIIVGEISALQEQMDLKQQQIEEEDEQPKAANPPKKRRTKKRDAATTQITSAVESTSIDQTPVQKERQPPAKTTKRGRPKKIKSVDKPPVSDETVAIKMEQVDATEPRSGIESHIVELQPQQISSIDEDSIPSNVKVEQQKPTHSAKSSISPKNSVLLNEDLEISEPEHQEQDKQNSSHTVDENDVKLTEGFENNNKFQASVVEDVTMEDAQNKEEEAVNSLIGEQIVKRKRSLDNGDSDDEDSDKPTPKKLSRIEEIKARMEKFSKLRSRLDEGESANRKEVYEEHQRKKTNPKEIIRQERKREEAEKLLAKQQAEERGEDYERSKFWEYSIESVEKWEKKQEKKAKKSDVAFTDYNQVAHKKYKKQINELKPDIVTYNEQKAAAMASSSLIATEDGQIVSVDTESTFYRDVNSLQYASVDNQPSREAIERVVADVNKTIAKREKSSRQKTVNEEDDITYINERNRRFNEKIGRYYDKYTKEIKENFERGTAL